MLLRWKASQGQSVEILRHLIRKGPATLSSLQTTVGPELLDHQVTNPSDLGEMNCLKVAAEQHKLVAAK